MIITGKKFSKPDLSRVINGDTVVTQGAAKTPKRRLDHILMELYPEWGRGSLQSFVRNGFVTVDGQVAEKANTLVEIMEEVADAVVARDKIAEANVVRDEMISDETILESLRKRIQLNLPAEISDPAVKAAAVEKMRPQVIYEDDNVIVVNKPAGLLSVAKGEYCPEPTLEDYGLLVHRLDRDTSGVVILAKNEETQTMLRKQFQDRKTHKTYYAVVEGRPKLDAAKIDLPILRSVKRPNTFLVDPAGKPAQTFYKVIKSGEVGGKVVSLLELRPVTGRTHQLRVHLKYIGTPILGDRVYGPEARGASKNADGEREGLGAGGSAEGRMYLHARTLEITLPGGVRKVFEAELPKEFLKVFNGGKVENSEPVEGTGLDRNVEAGA